MEAFIQPNRVLRASHARTADPSLHIIMHIDLLIVKLSLVERAIFFGVCVLGKFSTLLCSALFFAPLTVARAESSAQSAPVVLNSLTTCLGKFSAAYAYSSYVENLSPSYAATSASFKRLMALLQVDDIDHYIGRADAVAADFSLDVISNPLETRKMLAKMSDACGMVSAHADSISLGLENRAAEAAEFKRAEQASRHAEQESERKEKEAQLREEREARRAEQESRLAAEKAARDHTFEMERLKAQTEKARVDEISRAKEFEQKQALAKLEAQRAEADKLRATAEQATAQAKVAMIKATQQSSVQTAKPAKPAAAVENLPPEATTVKAEPVASKEHEQALDVENRNTLISILSNNGYVIFNDAADMKCQDMAGILIACNSISRPGSLVNFMSNPARLEVKINWIYKGCIRKSGNAWVNTSGPHEDCNS